MKMQTHKHECPSVRASYNSRNPKMPSTSRLRRFCCALVFITQLFIVTAGFASDWRKPVAQLAAKISAGTGPGVVALDIINPSSIPASDVEQIRRNLTSELGASGVRVWQPDQAAATVRVTLSENLESYVWVAEIQQGTAEPTVVMISADRPAALTSAQNAPALTLRATPLMSQPEPILDVAILEGSPRRALLLSTAGVTVLDFKDGRWIAAQSLAVAHATPFPRDARGRIVLRKDHLFDAYLPGTVCRSAEAGSLSMLCSRSDDPWPLVTAELGVSGFFAPARNFFTGVLAPGVGKQKSAPPFYSAVAIPRDKYVLWLFSGVDGQLHLLDGINQQTSGRLRWGGDVAGIRAACRPDWFVLATSAGGDEESMQAFDFPDREPVAASQKLPLNGPVTALWTQQNGESATAVYRNSETGDYEALQLTLACSQ